jgi:hypothetical protein
LDRQPAPELLPGVLQAWFDAFCDGNVWDEQLDVPRFRKAFVRFSKTASNVWPQPAEILALLPDRETFVALGYKTEKTEASAKTMAEIAERLGMSKTP